jgi:cysteine desulfurase
VDNPIIYLDYAAASPLDERVLRVMQPYMTERFYNPSSPYAPALQVRAEYEAAKDMIARMIGGRGTELIMTAGATESINLAFSNVKGHIVLPAIEHHAVRAAAEKHEHTYVAVDARGRVHAEAIAKAIRNDTELVSVALANNEIGTMQPLREISAIIERERQARRAQGNSRPIYFHTDASQGVGMLDVHVARLGVDMLTLNAGKVYGPKQVGALWVSSRVQLHPIVVGGGQERGLRSGTENVAGAIGFAEALRLAEKRRKAESERLRDLRDMMQGQLTEQFPRAVVSGHIKHRLPNFLHISFPEIDAERVLFALEMEGVLVATGSACAANKGTRSHVLEAIGLSPHEADGSIRISLGRLSTREQCDQAVRSIGDIVSKEYARIGVRG